MFRGVLRRSVTALAFGFLMVTGCVVDLRDRSTVKLYALDCGSFEFFDISAFSREGYFDGEGLSLAVPCFLIRHPDGDLLWDAGLEQSLADTPEGVENDIFHMRLETRLTDQLRQLGLEPPDLDYLSISHSHWDHAGNCNLFAGSTFIVQRQEHSFMFSEAKRADPESFAVYSALEEAETVLFEEEYDVFGDGTVVIKAMPGHTPGHSVLLLRLENAGAVLLTGDLYIHARGRELRAIPTFNTDEGATVESMERFEALAREEEARVVIQHERADFEALPPFPAFLD